MQRFTIAMLGVALAIQVGFLGTMAWSIESEDVRGDCKFTKRGPDLLCNPGIAGVKRCINRDTSEDPPVVIPGVCTQIDTVGGKRCKCVPLNAQAQISQIAALATTVQTLVDSFQEVSSISEGIACDQVAVGIILIRQSTATSTLSTSSVESSVVTTPVKEVYTANHVKNLDTIIINLPRIASLAEQCEMTFDHGPALGFMLNKKQRVIDAFFSSNTVE